MSNDQIIQLIQVLSPLVGPLLTSLIKRLTSSIGPKWLPVMSAVFSSLATAATGAPADLIALSGVAGVGAREIADQQVYKRIAKS